MIVADENIPALVVENLRMAGYPVTYISEVAPGIGDEEVLERALALSALVLTADKDFGELIFLRRRVSAGVVLLRIGELADVDQAALVVALFAARGSELAAAFTVVTADRVRIRPSARPEPGPPRR